MSYNEKLCGISYKLDVPKEGRLEFLKGAYPNDDIDKYVEEWDDDWFYEFLCDKGDRKALNKWKIMSDYNGDIAWVYITDSGESNGDINFSITLSQIQDYISDVTEAKLFGVDEVDPNKVKLFAFDWYNGCDCPLIF